MAQSEGKETMDTWTLSRIADAVNGQLVGTDEPVTGPVVTDSREARQGSLFVARRGEHSDGHAFLPQARERGAVGAIVERAQEAGDAGICAVVVDDATRALGDLARAHLAGLREGLDVVAVTGSAGKTTTKDLLGRIMSADASTVAPRASFNNEVGLPLTVLTATRETRHLVLEMGASGSGHIAYLTTIAPPDVAIELMVGRAHLGGFGSIEALAAAKAELVDGLAAGGTAVLNADDPRVAAMAQHARGEVWTFSMNGNADVNGTLLSLTRLQPRIRMSWRDHVADITLGLLGAHHVTNALAAATGALAAGISWEVVVGALEGARAASPHRMDLRELAHGVTLIDDAYNANPDSLAAGVAAAAMVARETGGRVILVAGDMLELGPTSADIHRQCGAAAAHAGVACAITLGDQAEQLGAQCPQHTRAADPNEAAETAWRLASPGDVILVKGSNSSGAWKAADILLTSHQECA